METKYRLIGHNGRVLRTYKNFNKAVAVFKHENAVAEEVTPILPHHIEEVRKRVVYPFEMEERE